MEGCAARGTAREGGGQQQNSDIIADWRLSRAYAHRLVEGSGAEGREQVNGADESGCGVLRGGAGERRGGETPRGARVSSCLARKA